MPLRKVRVRIYPRHSRMLAGSPSQTTPLDFINHKCLGVAAEEADTAEFPPRPERCTGGIRSEVTFPSCWDGRLASDLPYTDPTVVHPSGGWAAGRCPATHPWRLPTLFYEAIFHTQEVVEAGDRLVYSFNDTVGYGFHGDFFNGWEEGVIEVSSELSRHAQLVVVTIYQGFIEYCRTHEDGFSTQCGAMQEKHPETCEWEYSEGYDQVQYSTVQYSEGYDQVLGCRLV